MSNTIRKKKAKRSKLKPYTIDIGVGKFKATKTDHVPGEAKGLSSWDKLVTKNANRSKKKALRRKLKNQIKNYE